MAMSFGSVTAVADQNGHILDGASSDNPGTKGLPDVFGLQVRLNIFWTGDWQPGQRHQNVADDDSCLMRWPIGLDFENDGRRLLLVLQRLPQLLRKPHRLQSHTEIPARDAAFFNKVSATRSAVAAG